MGNDAPLLDLDALVPEHPTVKIRTPEHPDGKLWEMRTRPEFSILELKRIERLGQQATALGERTVTEYTEAELAQVTEMLEDLLRLVMFKPLDEQTLGALRLDQKLAIIEVFTEVCMPAPSTQNRTARRAATKKKAGAK